MRFAVSLMNRAYHRQATLSFSLGGYLTVKSPELLMIEMYKQFTNKSPEIHTFVTPTYEGIVLTGNNNVALA